MQNYINDIKNDYNEKIYFIEKIIYRVKKLYNQENRCNKKKI